MAKRDNTKEFEDVCKSIDETADKLRAAFLIEKNDQIKSCTKDIYEWICNNENLTIRGLDTSSQFEPFLKKYKHLIGKDIITILDRLVEKKHIIKIVHNTYHATYKFNRNV